ncbi:hypothetical protein WJU23_04090 [Prosthecobacter sp. SYSU 5D2]|uniref:hypothetical protein n=1 Tax=Prosthecobacter sp. SYSU 5D2 TaxID=3134134 RepID=UPI0031FF022A
MNPPPEAESPEEILAEVIRRDEEMQNGLVKPLTLDEFWATVTKVGKIQEATGRELAAKWSQMPHLTVEEAEAFEADILESRRNLPTSNSNPWTDDD